jgi:hypothetical protein
MPASSSCCLAGGNWLWPPKAGTWSSHSSRAQDCSHPNRHSSGSPKTLASRIPPAALANIPEYTSRAGLAQGTNARSGGTRR